MSALSTKPYRGTKDLFPERQRIRKMIFNVWDEVAHNSAFQEYSGPILEPLELYLAKSSEEIVSEQLFTLTDRSDRKLGIRPEVTPTLARMVASTLGKYPLPLRWYCVETCMRYERPQRGRMRQFDQLNMDILGGDIGEGDFEVLATIPQMMAKLDAPMDGFKVRLNHREFINNYLDKHISLQGDQRASVLRLLDGFPKTGEEGLRKEGTSLGLTETEIQKLLALLTTPFTELLESTNEPSLIYLKQLIDDLNTACEIDAFEFDATIMRGFDYYTGVIFEVVDISPVNNRALFGGGRYDNLVATFGTNSVSGVGYGVSEISLYNFLEAHNIMPELNPDIEVVAAGLQDDSGLKTLRKLVQKLRKLGVNCEMLGAGKKPAKVFKYASKIGANSVIVIGPDEAERGTFSVKLLASRQEQELKIDELNEESLLNLVQQLRENPS